MPRYVRNVILSDLELLDVRVVLLVIVCLSSVDLYPILLDLVHYLYIHQQAEREGGRERGREGGRERGREREGGREGGREREGGVCIGVCVLNEEGKGKDCYTCGLTYTAHTYGLHRL